MENIEKKTTLSEVKTVKKSKTKTIKEKIDNVKTKVRNTSKRSESKKSDVKKLKLLITVVDRNKALFYTDLLEQFEVNMQMVIYGNGTAEKQMLDYLGLASSEKAVVFSFIREDKIKEVLQTLQEKFERVRNGKGIAFTVPLQSIISVYAYQFLSNNRSIKKEDK